MEYKRIEEINQYKGESISPMKTPDKIFELYSVPVFDSGKPEIIKGKDIGSSKAVVQKDDILLCKINPRINRVWVVGDYTEYPSIASSEWIVIRNNEYNPEYLAWYFRTPRFKKLMTSQVTGIGGSLTRAQPKQVKKYPVPIINRKEQDKVVEILNKANEIIEGKKKEVEQLDTLIKARFVEMFGTPLSSNRWEVKKISEISESILDGSNVDKNYYLPTGDVLFLRIQNVWNNEFRLEDSVYISDDVNTQYIDSSLHYGDLLITKIGRYYTKDSSLGRVSVYLGDDDKANYSNNIMRVRLKSGYNSEFVNALMNLDDYRDYIKKISVGGTDKRALSKKIVAEFPVINPPIEYQEKFIDFVHQVDKSKFDEAV